MTKVQQCGRIPQRDQKYVDIYREKQIRVTVKVLVPVKEHPKVSEYRTENNKNKFYLFNFFARLLFYGSHECTESIAFRVRY